MRGRCIHCQRTLERCRCDYDAAVRLVRVLAALISLGVLLKVLHG
jgi:hypothetical protein